MDMETDETFLTISYGYRRKDMGTHLGPQEITELVSCRNSTRMSEWFSLTSHY